MQNNQLEISTISENLNGQINEEKAKSKDMQRRLNEIEYEQENTHRQLDKSRKKTETLMEETTILSHKLQSKDTEIRLLKKMVEVKKKTYFF